MSEKPELVYATWERVNDIADEMTSLFPDGLYTVENCGRLSDGRWLCAVGIGTFMGRVPVIYAFQVHHLHEYCADERCARREAVPA